MTFTFDWAENREKFAEALTRAKANNNVNSNTVTDEMIMREYLKMGGRITQINDDGTIAKVDNKSTPIAVTTLVKSTVKRNARG